MFSYHDVHMAMALIERPKDGSIANQQARDKAAHLLLEAASSFRTFAGNNQSDAAKYLVKLAVSFELCATMA